MIGFNRSTLFAGSVLALLASLARFALVPPDDFASAANVPTSVVLLASGWLMLLGLPGVIGSLSEDGTTTRAIALGGLGALIAVLFVAHPFTDAFVIPFFVGDGQLPSEPPAGYIVTTMIAMLLGVVGVIAASVAIVRTDGVASWVATGFVVAVIAAVGGFAGLPVPPVVASVALFASLAAMAASIPTTARSPVEGGATQRDAVRAG